MKLFVLGLASSLVGLAHASCLHGTTLLPRIVTPEGKVEPSKFGYTDLQGPLNWPNLAPEYEQCRTGRNQSPIPLRRDHELAKEAPVIVIDRVEEADIENLGSTVETIIGGRTTFEGKEFMLKQFHMHTPSEHRIDDEYFPLEMHMVHEAHDGSIAIIAVLYQLSEDPGSLDLMHAVCDSLEPIHHPGAIARTGPLDFGKLIEHLHTKPLLHYTGSITTPPCTEGVKFLVTQEPLPIDIRSYNALKRVMKFNARYTQSALGTPNLLDLHQPHNSEECNAEPWARKDGDGDGNRHYPRSLRSEPVKFRA